jgi:dihydrofolate reductase
MHRTWRGRVFIGVTLDGYIARKDGDIEWLTNPQPGNHTSVGSDRHTIGWDEFYPSVSHLVIGRGTYDKVMTFENWPYTGKQVIVLSTTLKDPAHGASVVASLDEAIAKLEETGAQDVYVDGGKVIQTFMQSKLIDEITVSIAPVLIGEGLPLFGSLPKDCWLDLVAAHSDGQSGMVHITYNVRGNR